MSAKSVIETVEMYMAALLVICRRFFNKKSLKVNAKKCGSLQHLPVKQRKGVRVNTMVGGGSYPNTRVLEYVQVLRSETDPKRGHEKGSKLVTSYCMMNNHMAVGELASASRKLHRTMLPIL